MIWLSTYFASRGFVTLDALNEILPSYVTAAQVIPLHCSAVSPPAPDPPFADSAVLVPPLCTATSSTRMSFGPAHEVPHI